MKVKKVVLSLAIFAMVIVGASADMWYVQTFDDLAAGPLGGQDEWSGAATVQNDFSHGESGQSINVTGTITRSLTESQDIQYVSFYFMVSEEANMDWKLYMGNALDAQAAAMGLNPDNETIHIHGGDEQIPVDIKPEEWHQLGAVLDFNSTKWSLYLDDMENPLREGNGFRNGACDALAKIWLTIWANPSAGGLYMDDFMIGDGDVIPTSLGPEEAVDPALKLATLWGEIRAR